MKIDKTLIEKLNTQGPRYTSYPTAPQWQNLSDDTLYTDALDRFNQNTKSLSLYIHIPFCQSMCYYCACSVLIRKSKQDFGEKYIDHLIKEIQLIRSHITRKVSIRQLHIGGGTPNFLSNSELSTLMNALTANFDIDFTSDISIEIDPRVIQIDQLHTIKKLGFNRLSMGIQDFDPQVQKAINRIQPFEQVHSLFKEMRNLQFESINCDLIYGLPYQTLSGFQKTVDQIIQLQPDRIALYSYAHVPWLKTHQTLLPESALPDASLKIDLFLQARNQFLQNGFDAIAMDHFAKTTDSLSKAFKNNSLYRNFMGYTTKPADEFIGLGVSAIGFIENTFIQNEKNLDRYYQHITTNTFALEKGLRLSADDQIRQWIITELMCHFQVEKATFKEKFKTDFDTYFQKETDHLIQCEADQLITQSDTHIHVTPTGKLFIRNICMGFDAYLKPSPHQYSKTI